MIEAFANAGDVVALERVPLDERFAFRTIDALLAAGAARHANAPALIWLPNGRATDSAEIITFALLHDRVLRTANLLHRHGVRPGSAVSILLPNLPETHFALWGSALAGIANPINPLLAPEQIVAIMREAGSRVLITGTPDKAFDVHAKAQAVGALHTDLETLILVGDGYAEALSDQPGDRLISGRVIDGDEPSAFFHTGGTTGAPKLAQQTHWNQVFMAWTAAYALGLTPGDRILTGLPLFHANAAVATGLGGMFAGAASILAGQQGYRDKGMVADFWDIAVRFDATLFSGVPTVFSALLDSLAGERRSTNVRFAMCGAAPMPVSLFREFERRTGVRILELYGMTEGAALSTANPRDGERRIGSIGLRLPYQGCRTVLLDDDGAFVRDCAPEETGSLLLSGPNLFPGYRDANAGAASWPLPGWFASGDLARCDAQGYFWLTGRTKDLIIRGGHNIDPAMIEEALQRHPDVLLAAAVGRPDPYAGEVPVAYVTLAAGATASAADLCAFAREAVPERPAAPADVVVIDAIPVTAVGKIYKPILRIDAARRAIEHVVSALEPAADIDITVAIDPRLGMRADLRSRGKITDRDALMAALGRLPIASVMLDEKILPSMEAEP